MAEKEYEEQKILELACAAQRVNNGYLKEVDIVYTTDGVGMSYRYSNKTLMLVSTGAQDWVGENHPGMLKIIKSDVEFTEEIRQYYKRLAFSVMASPENSFQVEILQLLNTKMMPRAKFGFIACLPSTYLRDKSKTDVARQLRKIDDGYIAEVGAVLDDKDCELIEVKWSEKFECWSVMAIIDNRLATWFSKRQLLLGPCVLIKAKVKDHREHWQTKVPETRLNYVKAFQ